MPNMKWLKKGMKLICHDRKRIIYDAPHNFVDRSYSSKLVYPDSNQEWQKSSELQLKL